MVKPDTPDSTEAESDEREEVDDERKEDERAEDDDERKEDEREEDKRVDVEPDCFTEMSEVPLVPDLTTSARLTPRLTTLCSPADRALSCTSFTGADLGRDGLWTTRCVSSRDIACKGGGFCRVTTLVSEILASLPLARA